MNSTSRSFVTNTKAAATLLQLTGVRLPLIDCSQQSANRNIRAFSKHLQLMDYKHAVQIGAERGIKKELFAMRALSTAV